MTSRIAFTNPQLGRLGDHIRSSAARNLPLVERDRHAGARGAVICGLGPSLQKPGTLRKIRAKARRGWHVFGIKAAISFLKDKGIPVHYSVAMDPGPHQVEKTPLHDEVTYCVASSCHPDLFEHVLGGGCRVEVFHSACGYKETRLEPGFALALSDEDQAVCLGAQEMQTTEGYAFSPVVASQVSEVEFYRRLFGCGDVMCGGFTVGNRALALAKYMGFKKVAVAGLDFGWRQGDRYYAEFCTARHHNDVFMSDDGQVDGKVWHTRPDLLASAVDVARRAKAKEVTVIGDSLAASLARRDDAFLDQVCSIQ